MLGMVFGFLVFFVFLVLLFLVPYLLQLIWNNVLYDVFHQKMKQIGYGQAFAIWFFVALLVYGLQIPFVLCQIIRGA